MSKLRDFIEKLSPDRLIPTDHVFPDIDVGKFAADLNVQEKGLERGRNELPASSDQSIDLVETEIVSGIGRLRKMGYARYYEHMETYAQRLRDASTSHAELKTISETAVADYETSVATRRNHLANSRETVKERFIERATFKHHHRLWRTAHESTALVFSLALILFFVLIEAVMNGYFFAHSNAYGLLGGITVAIVISVVNIGFSSLLGMIFRYINHKIYLLKFIGFMALIVFIVFSFTFNLLIAHFRDVTGSMEWEQAALAAIDNFQTSPFSLQSIESWLLFFVGILICIGSAWKGYSLFDPYPGYGRVSKGWEKARENYAHSAEEAHTELTNYRDEVLKDLEDARQILTSKIQDAIDIIYARSGLENQLNDFLHETDISANHVLKLYREANKSARSSPAPEYFKREYLFPETKPFLDQNLPEEKESEQKIQAINDVIDHTINRIFGKYNEAIKRYESIEDLEAELPSMLDFDPDIIKYYTKQK